MTNNSPPPSPDSRIVEKLTSALIRWVPLGGSGFIWIHSLVQGNVAQSVLMFPVTAVTGVWAAYSESFLARLREGAGSRGREDADRVMGFAKRADSAVRWGLSGFEEKYLKAQANACEEYTTEGFAKRGGWKLLLEEVYVPLELSGEGVYRELPERLLQKPLKPADMAAMEKAQREGLSLWKLLGKAKKVPAYRQMAILAKGGFGKTTLLRYVTYQYATNPKRTSRERNVPVLIPFLLYLRDWRDEIAKENALDLAELIKQKHILSLPQGKRLDLPENWVANTLSQGKALVMFDGFDEVAEDQREAVGQWISVQMADYPQSVFIVTSRPEGYEEYEKCRGAKRLSRIFVKEFSADQRNDFIRSWYLCQERYERANRDTPAVRAIAEEGATRLINEITERPELAEMAKNPLMLNMIASFHRFSAGKQLPERRSDLYADICQMQLWDRPREKYVEMLLPVRVSKKVLQRIALQMTHRAEPTVKLPVAEITMLAKAHIQALSDEGVGAEQFVEQMRKVSELFVERDFREYEFSHRSFQDYLAACEIEENYSIDLVIENIENKWWRETILLYAEMANPSKLIEAAIELGTPTAVDVAYRCLQAGANLKKVSPELQTQLEIARPLQAQLQDKRYAKLEALLQTGKWKEADTETYELMIRTVGKEPGQGFSAEELRTFPCEELLRIDELWVKYSNGHFGFSVQKEIWVSVGGKLDGSYDFETWHKLANTVGWLHQKFSLSESKKGELPGRGQACGVVSFLASRLVNCRTR
ncbi:MAG: GUN4 domain-containing protein [Phormidesmis sp.]